MFVGKTGKVCLIMAHNQEIIKIGEVEFKVLYGDLLPKIKTDENRGIIDGIHRLKAAEELKLKTVPFHIKPGLTDIDKKHLAIKLNL